ncbi:HNH endonuclease, partial [Actinophytocola sp.]|uniref:HNH endonuclease n=1 Tax=Actinophytocola sp. TaxID=1872138 RepID=UPI002ED1DFD3
MAKAKHRAWFYQGARTLRAVARERGFEHAFPSDEHWYLCPLCLDIIFTVDELDTGELSVEHAPPKALGGNEVTLTCRKCNNDAGTKFDAEAHKETRLRMLFSGQSERPETVALSFGDVTARVKMHVSGQSGTMFIGDPKINEPGTFERLSQHMRMLSETRNANIEWTVTPHLKYSPDRARVAWIRAAYLAAFSLFGWKYILRETLQPIREHLIDPSSATLPLLSMYDPKGDPNRKQVWLVKEPVGQRSLLVAWGRQIVFLPAP